MNERTGPTYDDYDDILQRHYNENYDLEPYPFERYEVAYRYGFDLATDSPFPNRKWTRIEEEARRGWEAKGVGPWEDFKEAVRHAWDTAKGAISDE